MKSPNCASHNTIASGLPTEYPYSKPTAANSDSGESYTRNLPPVGLPSESVASSCSGVNSLPVLRSITTECRWVNVPRRVSWPDSRTSLPSEIMVPSASSSANAQSTLPS
jgi:hypothetical protein